MPSVGCTTTPEPTVAPRAGRKATSISLLVFLGVRADGQKLLLAIKSMGKESAEAWRTVLDGLITRGLRRPEFLIVDGAPGLDKAIAAVCASRRPSVVPARSDGVLQRRRVGGHGGTGRGGVEATVRRGVGRHRRHKLTLWVSSLGHRH